MTDEDRRLPGYEEAEAAPQTAQEWVARYRWVTPEQAAAYAEDGACARCRPRPAGRRSRGGSLLGDRGLRCRDWGWF